LKLPWLDAQGAEFPFDHIFRQEERQGTDLARVREACSMQIDSWRWLGKVAEIQFANRKNAPIGPQSRKKFLWRFLPIFGPILPKDREIAPVFGQAAIPKTTK